MTEFPSLRFPLDPGWERALLPVADIFAEVGADLVHRREDGEHVLPHPDDVLRVFRQPFDKVRVLILGQDPYPTPGHAMGLSFSLHPHVRPLARSLTNIFQELHDDLGVTPPGHGDLSAWADQGVALVNRVLTVRATAPGSHRGIGWEKITEQAVIALASREHLPLVAILWGADARKMAPVLQAHAADADQLCIIESPHPSPLSARRGFFGSAPFSRANSFLRARGHAEIRWELPQQPTAVD